MSKIEWTEKTWNPMVGCTKVSPGCKNCYAPGDSPKYDRPDAVRLNVHPRHDALTYVPRDAEGRSLGKGAQWTGEVRLLPHMLDVPLRRRKPTVYFVNSLSDMFHEAVVGSEEGRRFIAATFGVMAATPQHTYQVLTKHPMSARQWFLWAQGLASSGETIAEGCMTLARSVLLDECSPNYTAADKIILDCETWPLPNVWIGASVENQDAADKRTPDLLRIPAAVRFLSCEPLLGPVTIPDEFFRGPKDGPRRMAKTRWVIIGGENGPRPCDISWVRGVVGQCKEACVPVFVKQLGSHVVASEDFPFSPAIDGRVRLDNSKGGDPSEWPEDLRVRQMPGDLGRQT